MFRWPVRVMRGIGIAVVATGAAITTVQIGYWRNSETLFSHALAVTESNEVAHYNLGQALTMEGRFDEAMEHYLAALQIKPDHELAHNNLGLSYQSQGQWEKAASEYGEALRINPTHAEIHFNLAVAQIVLGDPTNAVKHLGYTLEAIPRHRFAHVQMGDALLALHRSAEATDHYREALRLKPDYAEAMDKLAWILATDSNPALRNGREAVRLAEEACRLTKYEQPGMLATLSAAYGELGDFKRAVEFARKAESLASERGDRGLVEKVARLRREFEENRAYRNR